MGVDNKEKEDETTSSTGELLVVVTEEATWGTLEELLLACAVNRHGTNSWDSIATELHKRRRFLNHSNNSLTEGEYFSADDCRRKYVDLRRRFDTDGGEREDEDGLLRMVEELRKLRVQQLKREVDKHDVSIVSLQKKVKILEEREKNNSSTSGSLLAKPEKDEDEPKTESPDLRIKPDKNAYEAERRVDSAEDRSVNESNSSKAAEAEAKREPDPLQRKASRLGESASESKRDDSINDDGKSRKLEAAQAQQEQSSDVQSSASLSKKKRRRIRVGGGVYSSGDELEAEEVSPANKRISVKSQPLIRFLDFLRSHKHGSVFHRRLPSQETEKYRNVVRQHMDLDLVQSRLERSIYGECHPKFYRDLLLIFTNAVLFYRKSSAEHIAARELRKLVIDEITLRTYKPKILPTKPDPEPQTLEPVVKKPRSSTTMVVCRRRTSIQGLSESMKKKEESHNSIKNNDNTNSKVEEKAKGDQYQKKIDGGSSNSNGLGSRKEKEGDTGDGVANSKKLVTGEQSSLGRGTLRLSNNNSKKIISKDGNKREKMENANNKEGSSKGEGDEPMEKRKVNNGDQKQEKPTTTVFKKQGVANFLKRIKQNSPSSQDNKANNSNDFDDEEDDDGRKEKTDSNGKKRGNARKNGDVVVTRTSGRKGENEAAPSSRATGRPPKRKAAMMGGGTPDSAKGGKSSAEKSRKKPRR